MTSSMTSRDLQSSRSWS